MRHGERNGVVPLALPLLVRRVCPLLGAQYSHVCGTDGGIG